MVEVRADVRQAISELNRLDRTQGTLSNNVSKYAKRMALAFGFSTAGAGIAKTIGLAMSFDKTIRQVGVQTDLSGKQLSKFSDLAKQMGADTIFSAQDAAQSMLELAKGGLSAADVKAGALKATLTLAAAGGLELADSAGYVTQGLNTFGLAAKDANQVVTALAGGANASTADVNDLGMALSQVGPGAKNAGMSIQETVAALSAFASAGIQGSDAGTSFKTFLTQLVPTTKKAKAAMSDYNLDFVDAKGNFDSLATISQELKDHLGNLGQAQRVQALKTIFGSDATRAATVLMGEGAKGVRKYLKATKDQDKAQEMANVTMEGASGAWENFKGSAETAAISLGQKALPAVTDMLNAGTDFVNDAKNWGPDVAESFGWIVDSGEDALGVLKAIGGVVGDAVGFFNDLPGPVKQVGVQAGIAALILPRLSGAVSSATANVKGNVAALQQWRAEMTYTETRAGATATAVGKLGTAAKSAAGIGGMVALTAASQQSNDGMKILLSTLGGAATGFSLGGPIGALIGGAGGGLMGLAGATHGASKELQAMHDAADNGRAAQLELRDALDQTTGAMTKQARQVVAQDLYDQKLSSSIGTLGLTTKDVVSAILGQEGALKRVNAAVERYATVGGAMATNRQIALSDASVNLGAYLSGAIPKFKEAGREIRAVAMGSETWKAALKGLPKDVKVQVREVGALPVQKRIQGIADMVRRNGLENKQIRMVLKALGYTDVTGALKKVSAAVKSTESDAKTGGQKVADNLQLPLKKVSPNLRPFIAALKGGTTQAANDATTGGTQVGANLKAGVSAGFAGTLAMLSAQAAAAVHAAVKAAKAAARSKSPSREMAEKVGQPLGEGIGVGILERTDDAKKKAAKAVEDTVKAAHEKAKRERERMKDAGQSLMESLMQSVRAGGGEWEKQFKRMRNWAEKALSGKAQKAFVAEVKKANRDLKALYAERSALESQLQSAQDELARRQEEKASFVSDATAGITSQATVVGIGSTASTIKDQLAKRLANVKEFAGLLGTLKGQGWPTAIIREIAAAGVENGLQAARALAGASAEDRAAITGSYQEIQAIGQQTAAALGSSMFDAGIASQQGLVDGLKAKDQAVNAQIAAIGEQIKKDLKRDLKKAGKAATDGLAEGFQEGEKSTVEAARNMAIAVRKAVEKELQIHSPSRVFRRIGRFAGIGLGMGLKDMEGDVANAGLGLARSAVPHLDAGSVFGATPSLPAMQGGGGVSFTFVTHNPVAEPNSVTQNKALQKAAILGLTR